MTVEEVITISLGGSIINPGTIDRPFLEEFQKLILSDMNSNPHRRYIIICGGGRVARDYIQASPPDLPPGQRDLLGIAPTWVNAQLVAAWFHGHAPTSPPQDFYTFVDQIKHYRVLVGGGFLPAIKTDEDAAIIADYFNSPILINVTNVDGVYDKDPRRHPEATKFDHMTYQEFIQFVSPVDAGPGASAPFTLIATKIAERSGCRLLVVSKDIEAIAATLQGQNVGTEISAHRPEN